MKVVDSDNQRRQLLLRAAGLLLTISWVGGALMTLLAGPSATILKDQSATLASQPDLGKLPLAFEPNAGQTDQVVKFLAHGASGLLFFTPSEVVVSLALAQSIEGDAGRSNLEPAPATQQTNVRVQFEGASEELQIVPGSALSGKVNYYIGDDPAKWSTDLPTYGDITYSGLYPGVDLAYTGTASQLKGTYTVGPGADPAAIRWRYAGVTHATVDDSGNLQLRAEGSDNLKLSEQAPVAWQEVNGRRLMVSASYAQHPDGTFGFNLGSYDPAYPLIIDPTLTYSTYLGGAANDGVRAVAQRGQLIAYSHDTLLLVAGYTLSTDFPTENPQQPSNAGGQDAFVSLLSAGGPGWVFSTYLGGSGDDVANGVAVVPPGFGNSGSILVTGVTNSTNFPVVSPYQANSAGGQDAFMALFRVDTARLVYSTYFGGSGNDVATAAAFPRSSGDCCGFPAPYFAGTTTSTNFPVSNAYQFNNAGGQDAFLVHFTESPVQLEYSTYLGGSNDDAAYGLSVSTTGEAYVTGSTGSTNFPMSSPYQNQYGGGTSDTFVTRFGSNGVSLQFSTYLGGSGADLGNGMAVDGQGNGYVTGSTYSTNFPTYLAYQPGLAGGQDGFVTKILPTGNPLAYSTYLGGSADDEGKGIAVDAAGFSYVAGWTDSTNFPIVNAVQPGNAGGRDAFTTKFELNGSGPVYSTYLGGSGTDLGLAVAVQTQEPGISYIGGQTGSSNYPLVNPLQPNNAGGDDGFLSTINDRCGPYADYTFAEGTGASIVPGITDTGNHCDTCKTLVQLPFPFRLYDVDLTQINAGSDGYLEWETQHTAGSFQNTCLPYWNWSLGYAIMPHMDDVRTDCAGCGIFTSVSGSAPNRIFNIEWRANRNVGGAVNFEVRLHEGSEGRFDFVYGTVAGNGADAVVGVQKKRGFLLTQYSCDQAVVSNGLQLTFVQPPCVGPQATETPVPPTIAPTNTPTTIPTNTPINTPTYTPTATATATRTPTATPTSCPIQFSDVPQDNTFYASIRCLACKGIISGYGDNTFRPNNQVTRGQLAKIVSNAAGFTEDPNPQIFEDVPPSDTFYQWINRLARRGHMSGYECGGPGEPCINNRPYFRPSANATRGQTSKIVSNAAGYTEIPTDQTFEDVPSTHTFYREIQRLATRNIMQGYPCGGVGEPCLSGKPYFRPANNVTRGQSAKIVANTFYPNCDTP